MRVCLGGTFDALHAGHEALLAKAFEMGDEVFVGLTSQKMAQARRARRVKPFATRKRNLERLLQRRGWKAVVSQIDRPEGRAYESRYDAIVVSPETLPRVIQINRERRRRGLRFLRVFTIPFFYARDGLRLSATRIAKKEIDAKGRRLAPLRIAVGTANVIKRDATAEAFRAAFRGVRVNARAIRVKSGVAPQPVGDDTYLGAWNRADRALKAWKGADYGVGIEAGLIQHPATGRFLDVQHVVVLDKEGGQSVGHGGGFAYPRDVEAKVLTGRTISQVLGPLAGDPRLGSTTGAVGFLSKGTVDRRTLTKHAVLLALVPRIRRDLYQE